MFLVRGHKRTNLGGKMSNEIERNVFFSDFFQVPHEVIKKYGAFNISLVRDMPLFIDPFLLFRSPKPEYKQLHQDIIRYLQFLLDLSKETHHLDKGTMQSFYQFREIKENWLGFSKFGNSGSGLGPKFAKALYMNLGGIFHGFGNEQITKSSHLEKLCIISEGVGRDNISDFTTNLILDYLLTYTETFAKENISKKFLRNFIISRAYFDYRFECWQRKEYTLPCHNGKYVILTPYDILTRDDTWINQTDMIDDIESIAEALPDCQLRTTLNRYLSQVLENDDISSEEKKKMIFAFYKKHPELVDHYIRNKEEHQDEAERRSAQYVKESEAYFYKNVNALYSLLKGKGFFSNYSMEEDSFEETKKRFLFFRNVIENQDGYRLFYYNEKPIKKEIDLQIMFKFVWFESIFDLNREVNNGRGPVDYKISNGAKDKSLIEFKLASNSKLRQNLEHQVEVYGKANDTNKTLKAIMCFNESEITKTQKLLHDLNMSEDTGTYIIDASPKLSASNVRNEEER